MLLLLKRNKHYIGEYVLHTCLERLTVIAENCVVRNDSICHSVCQLSTVVELKEIKYFFYTVFKYLWSIWVFVLKTRILSPLLT